MLTGDLRNKIDKIWDYFWTGGVTNPITVIEQLTYLIFIKQLDDVQLNKERMANMLGQALENPMFGAEQQELRWSQLPDSPEKAFEIVRDKIFPWIREELAQSNEDGSRSIFAKYMKNAAFMLPTPKVFDQIRQALGGIDMQDYDTKGDLYEYLLSKLSSAGKNGQFRTPRHIIKMMVDMMAPKPEDTICDPSAGSCGFLVGAAEYLREHYASELSKASVQEHFQSSLFNGIEFDATMIRIGAMNMMLHGIENPQLRDSNALSDLNKDLSDVYSLILANPPFKGSVDKDAIEDKVQKTVNTTKSELLFLALMLRMLKVGGRCAVIIPDGVLFGSSKAHKQLRQHIIEDHQLQAVISMPSGVFKPYAGVSTAVLIFTKTGAGGTDKVWFYDMQADGYSLDDKRTELGKKLDSGEYEQSHEDNNISDILKRWKNLDGELLRKKTEQSFMVDLKDLQANDYDLSLNRYKEIVYEELEYEKPELILKKIKALDAERLADMEELLKMIGEF